MLAKLLAREYAFPVTVRQMKKILHRDTKEQLTLVERLDDSPGISRVNYDGHFGPYIYLTIDVAQDSRKYRHQLRDLILAYADNNKA